MCKNRLFTIIIIIIIIVFISTQDKSKVIYLSYLQKKNIYAHISCQGKQGCYVACVQAHPLLGKNRRRGICDSPLLILYGAQMIFAEICEK